MWLLLGFVSINANELKLRSTEQDKMQGCIEEVYKSEDGLLEPVEYMCKLVWKNSSEEDKLSRVFGICR